MSRSTPRGLPAPETRDPARVRAMFGGIAGRYDLLNRLLSANLDRGWRRAAARRIPTEPDARVLDLCGGTGDLAIVLASLDASRQVFCCDFAHPMLTRADEKFARRGLDGRCVTVEADALRLPFSDAAFHAVTIAFGIRNLAHLDRGLEEIHRVLRPGGRAVILEFSRPTGRLVSRLYGFYLHRILPRVGDRWGRGGGAYGYLARTIADFPEAERLAGQIREAGFAACEWSKLTAGIVAIHTGLKG